MKNNILAYYIISGLLILACLILALAYPYYIGTSVSADTNEWSNFGEYIGGVISPLLSLLAFIGVLLSIKYQNDSNTRNEMFNRLQAIETTIVKHIEFHHGIVNSIKVPYDIKRTKFKEGRLAFEFLFEKYLKTYFQDVEDKNPHLDEIQKIDNAFAKLYQKEGSQFGFYFRNLFYLIKYIHETEGIDKIRYSKLVRAQLSKHEILLLMYNCVSKRGRIYFKPLVETYGLLNGIEGMEMIKATHKGLFDDKAYL